MYSREPTIAGTLENPMEFGEKPSVIERPNHTPGYLSDSLALSKNIDIIEVDDTRAVTGCASRANTLEIDIRWRQIFGKLMFDFPHPAHLIGKFVAGKNHGDSEGMTDDVRRSYELSVEQIVEGGEIWRIPYHS